MKYVRGVKRVTSVTRVTTPSESVGDAASRDRILACLGRMRGEMNQAVDALVELRQAVPGRQRGWCSGSVCQEEESEQEEE